MEAISPKGHCKEGEMGMIQLDACDTSKWQKCFMNEWQRQDLRRPCGNKGEAVVISYGGQARRRLGYEKRRAEFRRSGPHGNGMRYGQDFDDLTSPHGTEVEV